MKASSESAAGCPARALPREQTQEPARRNTARASVFADPADGGGAAGGAAGSGAVGNASSGLSSVNPGASTDLQGQIKVILSAVYVVIGMVAVIMIILGGVTYATSQGDAAKVKKGKDTILYGIIGLIIVLLAFAITNFVLMQLGA